MFEIQLSCPLPIIGVLSSLKPILKTKHFPFSLPTALSCVIKPWFRNGGTTLICNIPLFVGVVVVEGMLNQGLGDILLLRYRLSSIPFCFWAWFSSISSRSRRCLLWPPHRVGPHTCDDSNWRIYYIVTSVRNINFLLDFSRENLFNLSYSE